MHLPRIHIPTASLALAFAIAPCAARAAEAPAAKASLAPRQASERKTVDLTVYNSGLALIREERSIALAKGENRVQVPDIPATIDATSLHFASLTDPAAVRVLEQNYQYDLVSQAKLLEKYLGKTVDFIREDPSSRRETAVPGRLLAVGNPDAGGDRRANAGMVAEINGKIEMDPAGRLSLPALPEGLILKPQLEWMIRSGREGEHKAEISYLAGGISWSCDYVAILSQGDDKLDLTGWVTLTNNSGAAFRNAGLKLVAGDVHQVQPEFNAAYAQDGMALRKAAAPAPQFQQKELFEYKLYSLQRRTDLGGAETKQIELVTAMGASARKMLVYDGVDQGWRYWLNNPGYRGEQSFGQQSNPKVGVYVAFRNDAKSGLGMPLPKGKMRVYKKDDDGKEQFVGEDMLDHTPKDEELRLYLGNAFDVVGERAQIDFKNLAFNRGIEETVRIKVRNHKKEAVEVMVYEHPWRWNEWSILKSDNPHEKVDQSTIRFPIKIAPDKEKVVTYTIRYAW
jgi:hypothetical protein